MKSGRLHPSLSRISSLPPAPPSISFTPSLSPSLSSFPSATLSFPFCLHLIILLPLPPSLSLSPSSTPPLDSAFVCPLPSNLCLVWQSGGFVVMTTNPGNPATLSHPSSHLPSPSLFPPPPDYTDSFPRVSTTTISGRLLPSTCFHASVSAYLCFCVSIPYVLYAPLHRLPNARTTTPPPPPVLRAPARSGSADCRPGSSTSSTSCSQAAAPPPNRGVWRRVAGARNPAPRRVECACSRNETYGVYPLLAPLPDGNIERIAPRLIGVGKKERKKGKEEEEKER